MRERVHVKTLMTDVHPAEKAAPTFLAIIALGKFHCEESVKHMREREGEREREEGRGRKGEDRRGTGVIMAATPTGCLMTSNRLPWVPWGIMSP